nr:hypothetical protein [Ferrimicrobium acidiphilum]
METKQQEEKYYTKTGPEITPLAIEKNAISSELSSLADSNGLIRVQLDAAAVLPRIANGIYANFESGFRETYANAITACLNAKEKFNATPHIDVTYNLNTRLLEISEIDSTGLTYEMFKDVYVVVGRSGNFDGTKPGQFGFGRLAWTTLSDSMVLKTKYRTKEGQTGCFSVEGKNAMAFAILPTPDMKEYGTTVSMVLYDKISTEKLINYIKQACKLSPIDTYLSLVDGEQANREKLNCTFEEVMKDITEFPDHSIWRNSDDKYTVGEMATFKLKGFDVYALNITNDNVQYPYEPPSLQDDGTTAVLLNLPVHTNIKLPFSRALICITDERAFPPTADRERLKEDTETEILKQLAPKLAQYFSKYVVHNIDQFIKLSPTDKAVFLSSDRHQDTNVTDLLDNETLAFLRVLRTTVQVRGLDSGSRRRRHQHISLASMLLRFSNDELFIEDRFYNIRQLKLVRQVMPRAIIVMGELEQSQEVWNLLATLKLNGVTKYIADNKLKLPRPPNNRRRITIHKSTRRNNSVLADELVTYTDTNTISTEKLLKIGRKDSVTKYSAILESFPTEYQVSSAIGLNGGETLDEFLARIEPSKQVTNKGKLGIKDLINYNDILLALCNDPNIAPMVYPNDPRLIILDSADRLFEIAVYLTKNNKTFTAIHDPTIEFETVTGKKAYDFYRSYINRSSILWSLLNIYSSTKDKKLAFLLMKGAGSYEEDEFMEAVELALEIARQGLPTKK